MKDTLTVLTAEIGETNPPTQTAIGCVGPKAYDSEGVCLYQGDCLEGLKRLPDGIVDLTVTSPPYNIGKEYETELDIENYLSWCGHWLAEVHRITRPSGAFWLNLGYFEVPGRAKALPIAYLLWPKIPFYILQEVVWHYGAGVACRKMFSPRNEKWLWCVKDPTCYTFNLDAVRDPNVKYPNQKKNGKLRCNQNGKNPSDVWVIPKVTSGKDRASPERTPHPAQFPLAVLNRIILACTNPGDLVLDPFMGSGTTAVSCLLNKRRALGFEIQTKYVGTAAARLEKVLRKMQYETHQRNLFQFGDASCKI